MLVAGRRQVRVPSVRAVSSNNKDIMKFALSIALAASAMLPPAAFAESPQAGPADPAAAVPTPTYQSAFRDYQPWKDAQESPAKTWRAMNDGVAQSAGSMAGMGEAPAGSGMQMPMDKDQSGSTQMPMPAGHDTPHKGK